MGKEEVPQKEKRKRKLVLTLISMCVCFVMMGITVYAATAQSASVLNTITIKVSQDIETFVRINEKFVKPTSLQMENGEYPNFFPGTSVPSEAGTIVSSSNFNTILTKQPNENEKSDISSATPLVFSINEAVGKGVNNYGYTYMVYQIELKNEDVNKCNYSIRAVNAYDEAYEFNSQLRVYFATCSNSSSNPDFTNQTGGQTIDINRHLLRDQSEWVYIVIGLKTDLHIYDLSGQSEESFLLSVSCEADI